MADPSGTAPELVELAEDFEFEGELGRGGSAVVFRARERALDRAVAIKIVPGVVAGESDELARLAREARLVASLEHPNIVGLHAIRRLRHGSLALIMQWVPGETLRQHLRRTGALPVAQALRILSDVARALAAIHAHGVVHRDVKPENIYLADDPPRALLGDFGSAAPLRNNGRLTLPGMAIGTPGYMAPELVDGGTATPVADVYSLGLVGWEMLSGRQPWIGNTLFDVLAFRKHGWLPALDELRDEVPRPLARAIAQAIHPDPALRWASADALLDTLAGVESPPTGAAGAGATAARPATGDQRVDGDPALDGARIPLLFARPPRIDPVSPTEPPRAAEAAGPSRAPPETLRRAPPLDSTAAAAAMHASRGASAADAWIAERPDEPPSRHARPAALAAAAVVLGAMVVTALAIRGAQQDAELALLDTDEVPSQEVPFSRRPAAASPDSATSDGSAVRLDSAVADTRPDSDRSRLIAVAAIPAPARSPSKPPPPAPRASAPAVEPLPRTRAPRVRLSPLPFGESLRFPTLADRLAPPRFDTGVVRSMPGLPGDADASDGGAAGGAWVARQLVVGGTHSCVLLAGDRIACWGANDRGQLAQSSSARQATTPALAASVRFRSLALGVAHSCGLSTTGEAQCWGANDRGQLGDGTHASSYVPGRVTGVPRLSSLALGAAHSCGLDEAGVAYCWGSNSEGQLGADHGEERLTGTRVVTAAVFRRLALGWHHSCALSVDGRAYCWGSNSDGQLGLDRGNRRSPVMVATEAPLRAIAAGRAHTCALTTSDQVLCWGRNREGQVGDGTRTHTRTPRRVRLPGPALALAVGAEHTCALLRRGDVYCWGQNAHGQLGTGNTLGRVAPTLVVGAPSFVAIEAGGDHTCGLTAAQDVYCWGANTGGELGDGTSSDRAHPAAVLRRDR